MSFKDPGILEGALLTLGAYALIYSLLHAVELLSNKDIQGLLLKASILF